MSATARFFMFEESSNAVLQIKLLNDPYNTIIHVYI